ncbi:sensor histidine kinase [Neptuniibacter sp. QD72_48]|uniref:sensor histidine kinase n=1 Tax=unclassified Neptuniibacter TaxID=2630693 RepID=UPI0039F51C54
MSLRLKTILGIATIEALLLLLLISMTLDYLRTTNYEGLSKRAHTTATLFATTTKDAVLSYDLASLEAFVSEVMINPDLVYARVLGPENIVFAEKGSADVLSKPFSSDQSVSTVEDGIFDTYAEISEGGQVYGRVELGLDINSLNKTIEEAEQRSALIAAIEMGLVALFSLILGTYLTRQLKVLTQAAEVISVGDFEIKVPVKGQDEVADVAIAFNAMASNLHEASARRDEFEIQLKELNRSLEERVDERTKELVVKNEQLEQANKEIKEAQAKLLQSEKMASIGVLAAGVAHEINNPMGFVISNIGTLELYANNYRQLLAAHQEIIETPEGEKRDSLIAQLKEFQEELDFEFMNEDLDDLLKDTKEGSARVKDIVQGLKAFSHVDPVEKYELCNLNDCIEATLKVVNNELKYHCKLATDLADIPLTYCLPGKIKQVLLNLLVNAGQAITDTGTIAVSSKVNQDRIEIKIKDSGHGIAKEQIDKLFDPFFTTKKVGEGTGLGLSISYGIIVEEHNGDILVDSEPGKGTCFTLALPILTKAPSLPKQTESHDLVKE